MGCYPLMATSDPDDLRRQVGDAPIVLLGGGCRYGGKIEFISPSQLFTDLAFSAPPYAYTLSDADASFSRVKLHALLDCPRTPSLADLMAWASDLRDQAAQVVPGRGVAAPLSPNQLKTAVAMADLASVLFYYATSIPDEPFLLPDRGAVLHPAPNLLVDDAPWLDGRVDKSTAGPLPVVHASVPLSVAKLLGARALSAAVREYPDGPLLPLDAAGVDGLLRAESREAVRSQLGHWNRNVRSRAFRLAVRRAATHGRSRAAASSFFAPPSRLGTWAAPPPLDAQSTQRIEQLRSMRIEAVGEIRSKFMLETPGAHHPPLDVTLRPVWEGDRDGAVGSDSLTVLPEGAAGGSPTIFLKLDSTISGGGGSGGGSSRDPPRAMRQSTGHRASQRHFKRWKPCLATELDRHLGEGLVRDRMLLVELLEVDDQSEMPEVMNLYRIPMAAFDAWIGAPYSGGDEPRTLADDKSSLEGQIGSRVLFPAATLPPDLLEEANASGTAEGSDAWLRFGRLDAVQLGNQLTVAVTGDGETCIMDAGLVFRLPTQEETVQDARAEAARRLAAGDADELAVSAEVASPMGEPPRGGDGGLRGQGRQPGMDMGGADAAAGPVVERVEYRASEGWEASEIAARRVLATREAAHRAAVPPQREHAGMDAVLPLAAGAPHADVNGVRVPIAAGTSEGLAMVVAMRVSPGYDLVRVGDS